MKWFGVNERNRSVKNPFVANSKSIGKADPMFDLSYGKPVDHWSEEYFVAATEAALDGDPDDCLLNDWCIPIFSPRLQKALAEAGIVGIQYLPIRIARPSGATIDGFAVANILNLTPALDLDKAEYYGRKPAQGERVASIRKFVLRGEALQGYHIIRVRENRLPIFVSEYFANVYRSGKFTPWGFSPVPVTEG